MKQSPLSTNTPLEAPFPHAPRVVDRSFLNFSSGDGQELSLAALWARKYVKGLAAREIPVEQAKSLTELTGKDGRSHTASKILQNLSLASALAWSLTEALLSNEIARHEIDPSLINPWEIAADAHRLYQLAFQAYADGITPQRLSVVVGHEFGQVRQKYTAVEPRLIGFVSMQVHYTGQKVLERLSLLERSLVSPYLKVMDDHMYMPLREAYEAAASHVPDSPALMAVQHLLPISTAIAQSVCEQVRRLHPGYQSYSGSLNSVTVLTSSIRDVEMFQVYLCLCALEDSIHSVQRELFPLCVMLYPSLRVRWSLVQDMLRVLSWEMHDQLNASDLAIFLPYLNIFTEMFAPDVFS